MQPATSGLTSRGVVFVDGYLLHQLSRRIHTAHDDRVSRKVNEWVHIKNVELIIGVI